MGFLTGAYGKIMAGKYYRDLQYRQTLVMAQVRRASKEVADMEKYLTRMEKQVNANMQAQMQMAYQQAGFSNGYDFFGTNGGSALGTGTWTNGQNQDYMRFSQMMQMQMAQAQSVWQTQFDMIRESMLQPLKDKEDELQTELESLKTQTMLAKEQYEAHKEEEKAGVQYLKPDYTGQGS